MDRHAQPRASMAIPRIFHSVPLASHQALVLPQAAARHAGGALRLRPGDALVLFDGTGGEYPARVLRTGKREMVVTLDGHQAVERESPLPVTLAQGIAGAERMDFAVQKSSELGVVAIQPLACLRSPPLGAERAAKKTEHWQRVAISACEQCGRNRIPGVPPVLPLRRWLTTLPPAAAGEQRWVLLPEGGQALKHLPPPNRLLLLVGPEGGFAPEEAMDITAAGFRPVALGPRILRTETAGIAALGAIQALWGDL